MYLAGCGRNNERILDDKYVDEHVFVDFGRSGGMSQQKEAKRFLSALNKQSELDQKDCFSISV